MKWLTALFSAMQKEGKKTFAWKVTSKLRRLLCYMFLTTAKRPLSLKTVKGHPKTTDRVNAGLSNPLVRYASPVNLPSDSLATTRDNSATLKLQIGSLHFYRRPVDMATSQPKMDGLSAHPVWFAIRPKRQRDGPMSGQWWLTLTPTISSKPMTTVCSRLIFNVLCIAYSETLISFTSKCFKLLSQGKKKKPKNIRWWFVLPAITSSQICNLHSPVHQFLKLVSIKSFFSRP